MYRDLSYYIIKEIENKNLGLMIIAPVIGEKEQKVSISFVDNIDLILGGGNTTQHIQ